MRALLPWAQSSQVSVSTQHVRTCDLAKVSTTPWSTADAAVAAKAVEAAFLFCEAARAEAVAVAVAIASVCPDALATAKEEATAAAEESQGHYSCTS